MKRIVLTATLGTLTLSLAHAGLCTKFFSRFGRAVAESVDAEYAEMKKSLDGFPIEKRKEVEAAKVHGLLNRAFFPMMLNFSEKTRELDRKDIGARVKRLRSGVPIHQGDYVNHYARVDRKFVHTGSQEVIDYNVGRGQSHYDHDQMGGSVKNFFYARTPDDLVNAHGAVVKMVGMNITPKSAYGAKFSKQLIRTTQILMQIASENLQADAKDTFAKNKNLLNAESARAAGSYSEQGTLELTPLAAMIEGIQTFHQFATMFLAEKVPGSLTGKEALHDLIFEGAPRMGLTSQFTRMLPMALIGPANMSGRYFKDGLQRNTEGRLEFSPRVREVLGQFMERQLNHLQRRRGVCPMASYFMRRDQPTGHPSAKPSTESTQKSGLQILAEAYWHVFEQVQKMAP